jgi:hypothetical protein
MRILIGKYDGVDQKDFFDESRGILRVRNDSGTMWLPLVYTGWNLMKFDKDTDIVVCMLFSDAQTTYDPGTPIVEDGIALIAKVPPHMIGKPLNDRNDEAGAPTKLLGGSANSSNRKQAGGTDDYEVVATDEMLLLKGKGGQIVICEDGIITKGKRIDTDFFNTSKGGVLRENWMAQVIPPTALVAIEIASGGSSLMPSYLPDTSILKKVTGLLDIVKGVV